MKSPRRAYGQQRLLVGLGLLVGLVSSAPTVSARFTQTLPRNTFMLDVTYSYSWVQNAYDEHGRKVPLIDPMYRYEPGGGLQGIIIPDARVTFQFLIPALQYGILDYLTAAVIVPVALRTSVTPDLGWVSGDYYWPFGRSYSEEDFWQWAASMGQPKPGRWVGNKGVLSDIVLGMRYRFSDHIPAIARNHFGLALTVFGALPTGNPPDPEEVTSAGTTSWALHFQGELGIHLLADRVFPELDDRLVLGVEVFYEAFFRHRYKTPRGTKNPLLLTYQPYVGDTYTIDPGDFFGVAFWIQVVAIRGPAKATWLSKGDAKKAEAFPPLLTIGLGYIFTAIGQSDWESQSELWDWTQEEPWRPGYKNRLIIDVTLSLFRVGVPLQIYASFKNLSWIPGKNVRPADSMMMGIRVPFKFW